MAFTVLNSSQLALYYVEGRCEFEGNAVLKVNGSWLSHRVVALQPYLHLLGANLRTITEDRVELGVDVLVKKLRVQITVVLRYSGDAVQSCLHQS